MQFCRVDQTVLYVDGLFWGAVDSFSDLFNGFYYIFTGESTSKADKFDNFRSMKILNTPLTQKNTGIRTKRSEQEQNLQTKKSAISRPWSMIVEENGFSSPEYNRIFNPFCGSFFDGKEKRSLSLEDKHTCTTCVLLCFIKPILGNRYGPGVM